MRDELKTLRVFFRLEGDGGLRAIFAIDGRQYATAEDVKRDFDEAYHELERRRVPIEYETRPVGADEPRSDLPTWPEYKRTLPP